MLRPRHVEILSHLKIQLRSLSEKGLLSVPQPEVLELERWQERKTKRERERERVRNQTVYPPYPPASHFLNGCNKSSLYRLSTPDNKAILKPEYRDLAQE